MTTTLKHIQPAHSTGNTSQPWIKFRETALRPDEPEIELFGYCWNGSPAQDPTSVC